MTLARLRCFLEAASCENFTAAAQKMYISQPSLSKQIRLLEEELGVPLFQRVKRSVVLTPAGTYLYEQLKHLPDLMDRTFETVRNMGRSNDVSLRVGILEGQELNATILERMQAFANAHPQVEMHLERNGFRNLRAGVLNGHYDAIITMSFEEENIPGVESRIIIRQRGAFAINRLNPKSEIEGLTLEMLSDENFLTISPEESPNGYALLHKQCVRSGFQPRVVRRLHSLESLILGVEAGLGVAILDRNTRLEHNSEVRMVSVQGSEYSHVSAMFLKNNGSRIVRALAAALEAQEGDWICIDPSI